MVPNAPDVQRALTDGDKRSREASSLTPIDRALFDAMSLPGASAVAAYRSLTDPNPREAITPEYLWRRFKWAIIALGMFALLELVSLGKLISVMGTHF